MRSYPFIKDLFTNVLMKSRAIKGRIFLCPTEKEYNRNNNGSPKMGTEINTDEMGEIIKDMVVAQRLEKKYPLVLLMPPVSFGNYADKNGEWEQYRFVMVFLNSSYYSGTNQVMNPNTSTKTSTHSISDDWHDMKRSAVNFLTVLDRLTRTKGLVNNSFRLDQQQKKSIRPVSSIGADRASGVMVEFMGSVFIGCEIEDYDEEDISTITVPAADSHPEHQL